MTQQIGTAPQHKRPASHDEKDATTEPYEQSSRPRIGVIADDIPGGTDMAATLRRYGLRTLLFFGTPPATKELPPHDAVVIALTTRTLPPLEAVDLSLEAHRWLIKRGVDLTYLKHCSTFDPTAQGNLGPVLDALTVALNARMVITTPSPPEQERTQYAGQPFVADRLSEDWNMRDHPLVPMKDSALSRLPSKQLPTKAVFVNHETVRRGAKAIRHHVETAAAAGARLAFVDAKSEEELKQVGYAVLHDRLVAGTPGLAAGIAAAVRDVFGTAEDDTLISSAVETGPAAVIAGSCSARTLQQIEYMHRAGRPTYFLDAVSVSDGKRLASNALDWFDRLPPDSSPLIYSSVEPVLLAEIQSRLGATRSAMIFEEATGLIAQGLTARGVRRLIAAGGETCGIVVSALRVTAGFVGHEADRGVPWIQTQTDREMHLLLTSGNVGDPDLLLKASTAGARE